MEVILEDKALREFLKRVTERAKNPQQVEEIKRVIDMIAFQDIIEHFRKEEGPDGSWDPWSSIYSQHMARVGRSGNKILQWNGRLRQNLNHKSRFKKDGLEWFNNATVSSVSRPQSGTSSGKSHGGSEPKIAIKRRGGSGTEYPYAWGHDTGDGKLPARPFMWLSDKAMEKIGDIVLDKILED